MESADKSRDRERYALAVSKLTESPEMNIEFSREIFWKLKAECDNYGSRINRWAVYAVVSICIFALLNRNLIGSASVSGIQLIHLNFLSYIAPPAVSFCLLNIASSTDEMSNYSFLMANLAKAKFTGLYESKIYLLFPNNTGFLTSDVPDAFVTRLGKINTNLYAAVQIILIFVGYIVFEIVAYIYLFSSFKGVIGTVISLLITVLLTTMTVLRSIDWVLDTAQAPANL